MTLEQWARIMARKAVVEIEASFQNHEFQGTLDYPALRKRIASMILLYTDKPKDKTHD